MFVQWINGLFPVMPHQLSVRTTSRLSSCGLFFTLPHSIINPESCSQTINGLCRALPPPFQPFGHTAHPCLPASVHLILPFLPALPTPSISNGCSPACPLVVIEMQTLTQSSARSPSSLPTLEGIFFLLTLIAFYISATCELASVCVSSSIISKLILV